MREANATLHLSTPASWWSPPVLPATYPDRHPRLTDVEKTLMEQYITSPAEFMTGGRARNVLHQLACFDTPFMDIVKLTSHMDTTVVAARRHLFTYTVQTGLAFWAWPKEIWAEVIQAGSGRTHTSGTLLDRKTHKPTQYLFQYRNDLMGERFLNGSVIPLLCRLAGVSQTDVVGRITSH